MSYTTVRPTWQDLKYAVESQVESSLDAYYTHSKFTPEEIALIVQSAMQDMRFMHAITQEEESYRVEELHNTDENTKTAGEACDERNCECNWRVVAHVILVTDRTPQELLIP